MSSHGRTIWDYLINACLPHSTVSAAPSKLPGTEEVFGYTVFHWIKSLVKVKPIFLKKRFSLQIPHRLDISEKRVNVLEISKIQWAKYWAKKIFEVCRARPCRRIPSPEVTPGGGGGSGGGALDLAEPASAWAGPPRWASPPPPPPPAPEDTLQHSFTWSVLVARDLSARILSFNSSSFPL